MFVMSYYVNCLDINLFFNNDIHFLIMPTEEIIFPNSAYIYDLCKNIFTELSNGIFI